MLTLSEIINISINLATLSIACGWILTCLIQPYRDLASYLFIVFCASTGVWVLMSLSIITHDVGVPVNISTLFRVQITSMIFTIAAFYYFTVFHLVPKGRIAGFITYISPLFLIVTLLITWTQDLNLVNDNVVQWQEAILIALAVFFACTSFWVVLSSDQQASERLVLPAILMILVYGVDLFDVLRFSPLDRVFLMGAVTLTGWALIREQVFNPLHRLNAELRTTNKGLQAVIHDLASEKTRTEELNRELIITNQYKSEFLANISHELRTPLNSIIGYSELLHNGIYGQLTDKQHDRVEKIYRNGNELLSLISNILDLNKIDAGKMVLDLSHFGISTILESIQVEFVNKAQDKGLILTIDLPPNMPYLYGDSARIQQVIRNLIDNAIKFTKQGSIHLKVTATYVKKGFADAFELPAIGWLSDGTWIIISVQDTGIGIPPEHLSRIFDEFSQVDGSHTREYGGSGLGLAICRKLVEMHSGLIWVKSTQGQGSTFFVAFPTDIKPLQTNANVKEEKNGKPS
jgi:signal transduction histidine kinase